MATNKDSEKLTGKTIFGLSVPFIFVLGVLGLVVYVTKQK